MIGGLGRPPDPPQLPPPTVPLCPTGSTSNPQGREKFQPLTTLDQPQAINVQKEPPVSPCTFKKSFVSVAAGEKPPVVPPTREVFWYKDRPAVSFFDGELEILAKPFQHAIIGKFPRMPRMADIRVAFKGIGLTGAYELCWLDYKHILIHLTNVHDLNRIWVRQVWFIANQKMTVFRWSPDFHPEKESSIVPEWISFPYLWAHLQEKSALMMISKTVSKPLFVDEAMANGSRPSVARVCVEYDYQKPPLDHVWILQRTQELKSVEKGEERVSVPKGAVQQDGVRVYATKQGKKWQAVGTSGAKYSKGAEIIVPASKLAQTMVSNRFDAIQEEAMEKQKNLEKQRQRETNSAHTNAENNSRGRSNRQTGDTSVALQAEGGEAFHADEQGADESTSHDDRA
ncbi:protein of unknown function DUF4283 - like 10 [Theobroma cacao]|nr:protein of unknown function DUF4283 - like 10 [Theobroma cacao]